MFELLSYSIILLKEKSTDIGSTLQLNPCLSVWLRDESLMPEVRLPTRDQNLCSLRVRSKVIKNSTRSQQEIIAGCRMKVQHAITVVPLLPTGKEKSIIGRLRRILPHHSDN